MATLVAQHQGRIVTLHITIVSAVALLQAMQQQITDCICILVAQPVGNVPYCYNLRLDSIH